MSSLWDCEKCGYNHYEPALECKHCGAGRSLPSVAHVACMRCKESYPINSIEYKCFTDGCCQKCSEAEQKEFCDRKNQELQDDMSTIYDQPEPQGCKDDTPKAVQILNEAISIMAERGKSYDKSGGESERSMPKIVAMFNALTGHELTPEQGWKFMCCLKLARSEQGEYERIIILMVQLTWHWQGKKRKLVVSKRGQR